MKVLQSNSRLKIFILSVISTLFIPSVAGETGLDPLNNVVRMIAEFFTIPALNNEEVQLGIIKFGIFLIVFAIAHLALRNVWGSGYGGGANQARAAKVIAFVVAFIGSFFMPNGWALALGGVIAGLVIFLLVGGGAYYATMKLKDDWLQNLFGLIIILLLIWLTSTFRGYLHGANVGVGTAPVFVFGARRLFKWLSHQ